VAIMTKVFFAKQQSVLVKACTLNKTKEKQLLWKKLNKMDEEVRDAVVK
jgi:hypothetical protein